MNTKSKEKPEIGSERDKVETFSDFSDRTQEDSDISPSIPLDENLTTLQKIHAILLNCINLSQKEKLEFANSQRYFMKLYLQKLKDKLKK